MKSDSIKISVIMNCYNGERFLEETLQSLFAQTFRDFEVIFWDNQSTDRSAEILRSFSDPRVKYFRAQNFTTLGEARNLAAAKAEGEWIAFLDCDDLWHPEKLFKQMAALDVPDSGSVGIVYTRTLCLGGPRDGLEIQPYLTGRSLPTGTIIPEYLYSDNFIALSSALIRTSAMRKIGGIPTHFKQAEDFYLFATIAAMNLVLAVNDPLTVYRVHQNNLTKYQQYESYTEQIKTIKECLGIQPRLIQHSAIRRKLGHLSLFAAWSAIKQKRSWTLALHHIFNPSLLAFILASFRETKRRLVALSKPEANQSYS